MVPAAEDVAGDHFEVNATGRGGLIEPRGAEEETLADLDGLPGGLEFLRPIAVLHWFGRIGGEFGGDGLGRFGVLEVSGDGIGVFFDAVDFEIGEARGDVVHRAAGERDCDAEIHYWRFSSFTRK